MLGPSESTISLVIGGKGAGKSTLIKRQLARAQQFVVWDLNGEYSALPGARLWHDVRDFYRELANDGYVSREVFACPVDQFESWCSWVARCGDLLVVIEELSRYCGSGKAVQKLADLFDRSRHFPIDLICAASRIAEIPKAVVHQADELIHARTELPNDLDYLERMRGPKFAARIRNLPTHKFLRVTK